MRSLAPLFARAGFTSPWGKMADAPAFRSLRLPLEVEERLHQQARAIKLPFQEYVREVLIIQAMGHEVVKRTYASRVDAIETSVEETTPKE